MNLQEIVLICCLILGGLSCLWFFVIHKHVATIHAKVDSILNKLSGPKVQSTTVSQPKP